MLWRGYDPVGKQNKDRWQWINSDIFHFNADFTVRKLCTASTDQNLTSFMKYNSVYIICNYQVLKVNGYKLVSLSTSVPC